MITQLAGCYHLDRRENFDEYLKQLDVMFVIRKTMMGNHETLTIEVEGEGDNFMITIKDNLGYQNRSFTLGQEYYYQPKCLPGYRGKYSANWDEESNTLWSNNIIDDDSRPFSNGNEYSIECIDGGIIVTMKAGDVTAKKTYHREM